MWKDILRGCLQEEEKKIFPTFCQKYDDFFLNAKSHTMGELKTNKDIHRRKGIQFENLTQELLRRKYLLSAFDIVNVLKFDEISSEDLLRLRFLNAGGRITRKDMGIDIIAIDRRGRHYAIQCKYVKQPSPKYRWQVKWDTLSTFYALCERTGPPEGWFRHVVITNAKSVNRQGKKTTKDISICHGTLSNIPRDQWYILCDYKGYTLKDGVEEKGEDKVEEETKKEEMIRARQKWLDKL